MTGLTERFETISIEAKRMGQLQEQLMLIEQIIASKSFIEGSEVIVSFYDGIYRNRSLYFGESANWKTLIRISPNIACSILLATRQELKYKIILQDRVLKKLNVEMT